MEIAGAAGARGRGIHGKTDIAVYRPSDGSWWIIRSGDGTLYERGWGQTGDIPVAGDYDGDGKADLAVFRPSSGTWWVLKSSDGTLYSRSWSLSTDVPVPGDYDGDGKDRPCGVQTHGRDVVGPQKQ